MNDDNLAITDGKSHILQLQSKSFSRLTTTDKDAISTKIGILVQVTVAKHLSHR